MELKYTDNNTRSEDVNNKFLWTPADVTAYSGIKHTPTGYTQVLWLVDFVYQIILDIYLTMSDQVSIKD